jgi:hypothetical protein
MGRSVVERARGRSRRLRASVLRRLEGGLLRHRFRSTAPQLFVLGLPRSGTTLVCQYITHRLRVAYFTNAVGTYPASPCMVTCLQHWRHGDYVSNFESHYGKVAHPLGPREAGSFWGRFFPLEEYCRFDELGRADVDRLRNTIACVQRLFGDVPFVNKNVKHLLRIEALQKTFPRAHFLMVERDLQSIALSILRGRYRSAAGPNLWWSIRPPNFSELRDLPLVEQVAGQIAATRQRAEQDLATLAPERVTRIGYEAFCVKPEALIDQLAIRLPAGRTANRALEIFRRARNEARNAEEEELLQRIRELEESR